MAADDKTSEEKEVDRVESDENRHPPAYLGYARGKHSRMGFLERLKRIWRRLTGKRISAKQEPVTIEPERERAAPPVFGFAHPEEISEPSLVERWRKRAQQDFEKMPEEPERESAAPPVFGFAHPEEISEPSLIETWRKRATEETYKVELKRVRTPPPFLDFAKPAIQPKREISPKQKAEMGELFVEHNRLVQKRNEILAERAELTRRVDEEEITHAEAKDKLRALTMEAAQISEALSEIAMRLTEFGHPAFK